MKGRESKPGSDRDPVPPQDKPGLYEHCIHFLLLSY